jgi:hypothetical protein
VAEVSAKKKKGERDKMSTSNNMDRHPAPLNGKKRPRADIGKTLHPPEGDLSPPVNMLPLPPHMWGLDPLFHVRPTVTNWGGCKNIDVDGGE